MLERHSVDFRCRHVESERPAELLNQDTFYWRTLKGVGKVYVQVVVDTFACWPSGRSHLEDADHGVSLLYDRVLFFYEAIGIEVGALLTDNRRAGCRRRRSGGTEH